MASGDSSSPPLLEARNLRKSHGAQPILRGIDLTVRPGERIALMGPSGAGKTTLLNCLGAIEPFDEGELRFEGRDLRTASEDRIAEMRRTRLGTIFQFFHLLPTLTAAENIELPLQLAGWPPRKRLEQVTRLLDEVGITSRASALPRELSGGEQQRVAIARALAVEPSLILADEPTGNLDSLNADRVLELLERLSEKHRCALIMVTHEAATTRICHRTLHLLDGKIIPG